MVGKHLPIVYPRKSKVPSGMRHMWVFSSFTVKSNRVFMDRMASIAKPSVPLQQVPDFCPRISRPQRKWIYCPRISDFAKEMDILSPDFHGFRISQRKWIYCPRISTDFGFRKGNGYTVPGFGRISRPQRKWIYCPRISDFAKEMDILSPDFPGNGYTVPGFPRISDFAKEMDILSPDFRIGQRKWIYCPRIWGSNGYTVPGFDIRIWGSNGYTVPGFDILSPDFGIRIWIWTDSDLIKEMDILSPDFVRKWIYCPRIPPDFRRGFRIRIS